MQRSGTEELFRAMRAGYPYFYCQSYEINVAVETIQAAIDRFNATLGLDPWEVKVWDLEKDGDPDAPKRLLNDAEEFTLVVAKNFNWFFVDEMGNPNYSLVTYLQNRTEFFSSESRKSLIIIGSSDFDKAIPTDLQKDFMPVKIGLPGRDEVAEILEEMLENVRESSKFVEPTDEEKAKIVRAAMGLSTLGVKNAFAYSLIEDEGRIRPRTVGRLKAADVEKLPGLKYSESKNGFDTLVGYENAKDLAIRLVNHPLSKGLLFVGPAGTGKTHFVNCLGVEADLPVFVLELAQTMGEGLVGQAENAMRAILDVIRVNAPCILVCDEIEKGLPASNAKATGDTTGTRSMSQLLKFMSGEDRPAGIFIAATSNDINVLAPEWSRVGRWSTAPIYVGLPNEDEQMAILEYYKGRGFDLDGKTYYPTGDRPRKMDKWSGAEITAVCELSATTGLTIEECEKFIIPNAIRYADAVEALAKWAEVSAIPATLPLENGSKAGAKKNIRRIQVK